MTLKTRMPADAFGNYTESQPLCLRLILRKAKLNENNNKPLSCGVFANLKLL